LVEALANTVDPAETECVIELKWFWDNYTTDPAQRAEIYASPLQATTEQLKGLPPALLQVAENDVLRDEGEAYARKLDAAGVDVTYVRYDVRYDGLIHDFGLLNALSEVPAVRSALLQASEELKTRLATGAVSAAPGLK
jgi:acetyl esterase/lipase